MDKATDTERYLCEEIQRFMLDIQHSLGDLDVQARRAGNEEYAWRTGWLQSLVSGTVMRRLQGIYTAASQEIEYRDDVPRKHVNCRCAIVPLEGNPGEPAKEEHCHADSDGDCVWEHCPQLRDGEPAASGRHCPLDRWSVEDES